MVVLEILKGCTKSCSGLKSQESWFLFGNVLWLWTSEEYIPSERDTDQTPNSPLSNCVSVQPLKSPIKATLSTSGTHSVYVTQPLPLNTPNRLYPYKQNKGITPNTLKMPMRQFRSTALLNNAIQDTTLEMPSLINIKTILHWINSPEGGLAFAMRSSFCWQIFTHRFLWWESTRTHSWKVLKRAFIVYNIAFHFLKALLSVCKMSGKVLQTRVNFSQLLQRTWKTFNRRINPACLTLLGNHAYSWPTLTLRKAQDLLGAILNSLLL